MSNINTKSYWNSRFITGDWEVKGGRNQTRNFALSQIKHLEIEKDYTGTILDFGCGLGDAFPIYKKTFPDAKLFGLDISEEAVKKCIEHYGHLASFICGTYANVPNVDIIIASNIFEHLLDDKKIAQELLLKCLQLYIIVPYNEPRHNNSQHEHINSYNEYSFNNITDKMNYKIFISKGWGPDGIALYYDLYFKNIGRLLLGRKKIERPKQIMFIFGR